MAIQHSDHGDALDGEERAPFEEVARRVAPGGTLERVAPLHGGVSASIHEIVVQTGGDLRHLVVRRHGDADWMEHHDNVTETEFLLLRALHTAGIPVPEPLLLDASGDVLPSPYFVMTKVPGTTDVADADVPAAMLQMADTLARIHHIDAAAHDLPLLPEREDAREGALEYLPPGELGEELEKALRQGAWPATNPASVLHGDYWPGNVLWQGDTIAAVIDWEDAALGEPLSDFAASRCELQCMYGEDAMRAFSARYEERASLDLGNLPLWEVYVSASALATMEHWGLPPEVEAKRRQETRAFLERAARLVVE